MQDDPLSEFSGSVPLCADGGVKPQKNSVIEDPKLQAGK